MRTFRLFTLLCASLLATGALAATNYNINVGGVEVTSSNAGNVTGGDIKYGSGGGYVSYNASTNTLTLNNVSISRWGSNDRAVHNRGCNNLTIVLKGTCDFYGAGCSTFKLERTTSITVESGTTFITCQSSGDDAIWVTHDKNTTLTIGGKGYINLKSADGEGIAGSGSENLVLRSFHIFIDAKRGAFCDLASVRFTPDESVYETSQGITRHLQTILSPTGSSSYPHARNVKSITASGYVTVKSPTFDGDVSMLSNSSNYSKEINITDEAVAANHTAIGNFIFRNDPTTINRLDVLYLDGVVPSWKYNSPTSITVPGFVRLNNTTYPVVISNVAFRGMSNLQSAHLEYGVCKIGTQAFYNSQLSEIHIPSSVTEISQSAFEGNNLKRVYWASLDPSKVTLSSTSFSSQSTKGTVYLPTQDASDKLTSSYVTNSFNKAVSNAVYDFQNGSARYVATKRATIGGSDGEMSLTGNDGSAVAVTSSNGVCTPRTPIGGWSGGTFNCTGVAPTAFLNNTGITSVNLSHTAINTVGSRAFSGATAVKSLTIGEGVTTIGTDAFYNCSSIQSGVWNAINCANFTSSTQSPFYYSRYTLSSVTLGSKVKSIPDYLFYGCAYVKSVSIPSSVTYIGEKSFSTVGLTSVTIPNSVTQMGPYAFSLCSLASVSIGSGLSILPEGAFSATSLTTVTIPNTVQKISDMAFMDCNKLATINFSSNLETIGVSAFSGCTALTAVTLPDKTSILGGKAFSNCQNLATFTIGTGMLSIGYEVFKNCGKLKTLNWNATEAIINDSDTTTPLKDIANTLTTLNFGDNVTYIDEYLCNGLTALKSVTLPSGVKHIANEALSCSSLERINSLRESPSAIHLSYGVFAKVNKQTCELHVPYGSRDKYKVADQWKDFFKIIDDLGAPEYGKYDVNRDRHVDVGDVNAVLEAILNNDKSAIYDVNGDNNVDVGDVNSVLEYILES